MKRYGPVTEKAARMRLSRHLAKKNQIFIKNKSSSPSFIEIGQFMVIDSQNNLIVSDPTLTAILNFFGLLKHWEYVVGEYRED